ncbi:MAG: pentapeptide repeat-containing protein, partial [Crocinitomicaceae bacterium]|nr:pentapeptide repeat-containing protein [Crocinitomicaceae bacterium]
NRDFSGSSLQEVDFTEANLAGAIFNECDFHNTVFDRTNLMGANFSTAQNYRINPTNNTLKNAYFSYPGLIGLLSLFNIKIVK